MTTKKKRHRHAHMPMHLTDLQLLEDMERKVRWNLDNYREASAYGANDPLAATYASLDYCIAVVCYRDWIVDRWINLEAIGSLSKIESGPPAVSRPICNTWLNTQIEYLGFCQEIANTTKHGQYDDKETLRNPYANMRGWLTPAAQKKLTNTDHIFYADYCLRYPEECSYDRGLYADGYETVIKGNEVLHLPFEQLRTFARRYGIG